jgi:heterotetrameric sarcosine oxidase gamma subunit
MILGARWLSDELHWPASYEGTDESAEMAAITGGAALAEVGPFDELLLRGPGALDVLGSLATDPRAAMPGRVVAVALGGERWATWILERDEILLLSPSGGSILTTRGEDLVADQTSVLEMSGARTALRLVGPHAPRILVEVCPDDTTPATMQQGTVIQAPLAGVRALIAREDCLGSPGYTILIARDEAAYTWESLRAIGTFHGLIPVGPTAVAAEDGA